MQEEEEIKTKINKTYDLSVSRLDTLLFSTIHYKPDLILAVLDSHYCLPECQSYVVLYRPQSCMLYDIHKT